MSAIRQVVRMCGDCLRKTPSHSASESVQHDIGGVGMSRPDWRDRGCKMRRTDASGSGSDKAAALRTRRCGRERDDGRARSAGGCRQGVPHLVLDRNTSLR